MKRQILLSGLLLVSLSSAADAQQSAYSPENLEQRRLVLMKGIVDNLVQGKISSTEAQEIAGQLGDVLALQAKLSSDKNLSDAYMQGLSASLDRASAQLASVKHEKRIWRGINPHDTALDRKIADALSSGRVNKEEAGSLQRENDALKARETAVLDSVNLSEAIAVANDQQALEQKLDARSKRKH